MDLQNTGYPPAEMQRSQRMVDEDNLNVLSILHFVLGGLTALFASIFIFHIIIGLMIVKNHGYFPFVPPPGLPYGQVRQQFPPEFGYLFVVIGSIAVVGGWTLGVLTAFAGNCIRKRKSYVFCLVIAGLNCIIMSPLNVALAVFTFIVLQRPSVRPLFGSR